MVCGRVLRTTRRAADTSPDVLSFGDCQDATEVRTTLGITPGRASTLRARGMARSSFEMRRPVALPRLAVHGGVTRAVLLWTATKVRAGGLEIRLVPRFAA